MFDLALQIEPRSAPCFRLLCWASPSRWRRQLSTQKRSSLQSWRQERPTENLWPVFGHQISTFFMTCHDIGGNLVILIQVIFNVFKLLSENYTSLRFLVAKVWVKLKHYWNTIETILHIYILYWMGWNFAYQISNPVSFHAQLSCHISAPFCCIQNSLNHLGSNLWPCLQFSSSPCQCSKVCICVYIIIPETD